MNSFLSGFWASSQKRIQTTADKLTQENLRFRLNSESSSLGFLMLHIAESQLSLAKLFFAIAPDYQPTMAYAAVDEGQEISADLIQKTLADGRKLIAEMIENLPESEWGVITETRFGSLSKFDALAFIIHHNAYHLGQAGLTLKRGK